MIRRMDRYSLLFSLLVCLVCLGCLGWLIAAAPAAAQQPPPTVPPRPPVAQPTNQDAARTPAQDAAIQLAANPEADPSYRLGPGDLLAIRVFGRPELGSETRVDGFGRIRLPFIQDFQVGCMTEVELATAITEKYKKYLRDPQVDVMIKEYRSQPVAVIGAVNQPGRFQLTRRIRLMELVTYAGGPSNRAGNSIHVIHSTDHETCAGAPKVQKEQKDLSAQQADLAGAGDPLLRQFSAIKLRDLMDGNLNSNPYVQPGDIISIPEADQFFVTGSVVKPGAYALNNKMTLTQAVALAGGINMEGAKNRIRLVRPVPGTEQRKETVYNIDDILKRKTEDIALMPNDIIEVPGSTARAAQRNLLGVSISMLSALPFFILR